VDGVAFPLPNLALEYLLNCGTTMANIFVVANTNLMVTTTQTTAFDSLLGGTLKRTQDFQIRYALET